LHTITKKKQHKAKKKKSGGEGRKGKEEGKS